MKNAFHNAFHVPFILDPPPHNLKSKKKKIKHN